MRCSQAPAAITHERHVNLGACWARLRQGGAHTCLLLSHQVLQVPLLRVAVLSVFIKRPADLVVLRCALAALEPLPICALQVGLVLPAVPKPLCDHRPGERLLYIPLLEVLLPCDDAAIAILPGVLTRVCAQAAAARPLFDSLFEPGAEGFTRVARATRGIAEPQDLTRHYEAGNVRHP